MPRRRLIFLVKLAVTAVGLIWVARQIDGRTFWAALRTADLGALAIAFGLVLLGLVVRAWRWQRLLRGVGASAPFGRLLQLYVIGNFFNAFLPSGFGGDVVRAAEAAQDVSAEVAAATVFVDRLSGLLVLFALALIGWPLRPADAPDERLWVVVPLAAVGCLAGAVLIDGRLVGRWAARLAATPPSAGRVRSAAQRYLEPLLRRLSQIDRRAWTAALLISLLFNGLLIGWWFAAGRAVGLTVPWRTYLLVVPLLSLALLVPSVGGLGVREALAPLLLVGATGGIEQAAAAALLVTALERVAGLVGGPVYLWSLRGAD